MVTLYFHFQHNNFPTTADRDFIFGLHVYFTQSHTFNVQDQGQDHEFGARSEIIKLKVNCCGEIFIILLILGMHVYLKQSHTFNVDISRPCILTCARFKVT